MNNSFKATNEQVNQIKEHYKDYQIENDNPMFLFKAKTNNFSVFIYNNNTVLFQGKDASNEYIKWYMSEDEEVIDHVGSDEVGVGDYFGPIVVTASLVKKEDYEYLKFVGVRDSKQLSDKDILEIAPMIIPKIKSVTFVLSNNKYNEIHTDKDFNLNKIKAYLHNFVLYKLVHKEKFDGKIIIDQFCSEDLYYSYLRDYKTNDIQTNIYFTIKAENKYLAVACSSIIARYTFLKEIEKLEQEIGYKIPLGASSEVDKLGKRIVDEKGIGFLKNYVKFHFKNTEKILEM